jgi:folate-dependent phosphoribosylglycinamide formyltransferase PurN
LAARILEQEHRLLVRSLQWIADGRVKVVDLASGRKQVRIQGASGAFGALEELA